MPKISVLMGIYDCADTLEEAAACLQAQTLEDWECILCDDGSTDGTCRVAERLCERDRRFRLLRNGENRGLAFTLDHCLEAASGEYVARMDGDDRCIPERFALQSAFLDGHPEYAIVSGWMESFDREGTYGRICYREEPSLEHMMGGSQFCHASAMMRREALVQVGGYRTDPRVFRVEDYDLWIRMYEAGFRGYNLQQVLYQMRDDRNAARRRKMRYRWNESLLKWHLFRSLRLPLSCLPQVALPVVKGLLPLGIYQYFHRKNVGRGTK